MGETYVAQGLYVWDVTLDGGETRKLLSTDLPVGNYGKRVTSMVRGAAYVPGVTPPVVASLTPATKTISDDAFTLEVNGSAFQDSDVILWNGSPVPTTFVSASKLTTPITPAPPPLTIPVAVRTVSGSESNTVMFAMTPN